MSLDFLCHSELRTNDSELLTFDPLNINFDKGQKEGYDQWASYQSDQSKKLDASQDSEEEQQGMDLRPCTDEQWPKEIIRHTNSEYSQAQQDDPFQKRPLNH